MLETGDYEDLCTAGSLCVYNGIYVLGDWAGLKPDFRNEICDSARFACLRHYDIFYAADCTAGYDTGRDAYVSGRKTDAEDDA